MLSKVGRKRCPRKDDAFPVAGPLGGARTPVRRNGTGPSRGTARGDIPRPSQPRLAGCDGHISVGDPSSAPIEERVSCAVLFPKVRVSGGWDSQREGRPRALQDAEAFSFQCVQVHAWPDKLLHEIGCRRYGRLWHIGTSAIGRQGGLGGRGGFRRSMTVSADLLTAGRCTGCYWAT